MAYKILISGDISGSSGIGVYSVSDISSQLTKAKGDDLLIDINSYGGCVQTGFAIYAELRRYAKTNNATITTRANGFVASIATVIFLAGDKRIVNEYLQPFVHLPRTVGMDYSNADELAKEAISLEATTNLLAKFYSEHTNISIPEAINLMKNDTWMDAEYCLKIGFATEIEKLNDQNYNLVAKLKSNINQNKKMKNESIFLKVANLLGKRRVAQLELSDMAGNSVVFPELEEEATPKEGDKVTVDGDAAHTGVVETEDYVLDVTEGVVVTLVDKNEANKDVIIEDLVEIIEDLEDQVASARNEVKAQKAIVASLRSGGNPRSEKKRDIEEGSSDPFASAMNKIKERQKPTK